MLLRNYDNYNTITSLNHKTRSSTVGEDLTTFGDGFLNIKDIYNGIRTVRYESLPIFYCWSGSNCHTSFGFGKGTNPESYDDYQLTTFANSVDYSIISDSINHTNAAYNESDKTWENTITETYCALKDITVSEIGVYQHFIPSSSSITTALIYRKVLDTPIEVPANGTFTLSFTTKVSANPNKPVSYEASAAIVE